MSDKPRVIKLTAPLTDKDVAGLHAGDKVLLSGIIYTARDAAHKRMFESLAAGQALPVELKGQVIYYVGPCPAPPGKVIGSAGPTTSGRVDKYTPAILAKGLKGMIGKGFRSTAVIKAMQKYCAVYFAAVGGAGALIARCIKEAEVVAYPELGPEAIHRLRVEEMPLIVAIDSNGMSLYERE